MNKQTLYYLGAVGGGQSLSLVVFLLYINNFTPTVYAIIGLFETALLLLQSIVGGAVEKAAQRFYVDNNPSTVISTASSIALAFSFFISPVLILILTITQLMSAAEIIAIYFAAVSYVLHAIVLVKYQFEGKPKKYFLFSMIKPLLLLISILFLLHQDYPGQEIFIYSCYFSGAILLIISSIITRPSYNRLVDKTLVNEMLKFSLPFLPTLISAWIINWSSRFFMTGHVELDDIGIFSAAQKIAMLFFVFSQALTLVATPRVYRLLNNQHLLHTKGLMVLNIKVLAFLALLIVFFLPIVINYIVPNTYVGLETYLLILICINFISASMGVTSNLLFSFYKKTFTQMVHFLFIAVLAILMNTFLIPMYGIIGVFISLLLTMSFMLFGHIYLVQKFSSDVMPTNQLALIICIFLGMLLSEFILSQMNLSFFLELIFKIICLSFVLIIIKNEYQKLEFYSESSKVV